MADQVFSTIQIPVNQWRWLPVNCVSAGGVSQTALNPSAAKVSFIRYGEVTTTNYDNAAGYDNTTSTLSTAYSIGASTIKLLDTSNFPPDNGRIRIDAGNPNDETLSYSYNNVSTGELTLVGTTTKVHAQGEAVLRVDWAEVNAVVAPGSYLLLLPPSVLSVAEIFTYIVTNIGGGGAFEPFKNTIDIVGTTDKVTYSTPSVSTCKLYGFLVDVGGSALLNSVVSARLLGTPSTSGSLAISDSIVSTKTDANGYFEFTVAQGTTVDVIIPDAGYRRTLTVPNTTLAKLFEIA